MFWYAIHFDSLNASILYGTLWTSILSSQGGCRRESLQIYITNGKPDETILANEVKNQQSVVSYRYLL